VKTSSSGRSVQLSLPPVEVNPVDPPRAHDLELKRRLLREAIDESGWKHEALAASLELDPAYLSRMLAGDKPITLRHLDALPDDIETIYAAKYATALGNFVAEPAANPEDAMRKLVSGFLGMFGGRARRAS